MVLQGMNRRRAGGDTKRFKSQISGKASGAAFPFRNEIKRKLGKFWKILSEKGK